MIIIILKENYTKNYKLFILLKLELIRFLVLKFIMDI